MTHLLIITTLDVEGRRNNREHHAIRHLAPHFDSVSVVYRRRGQPGKSLYELTQCSLTDQIDEGVRYIGIDPALNPSEGAVRNFSGAGEQRNFVRRAASYLIDTAGIIRDILTMRGLYQGALAALDGSHETVVCEAFGPWAAQVADRLVREGKIKKFAYVDRDYEPGFMVSEVRRKWAVQRETNAARCAALTLCIGNRLAARFSSLDGTNIVLSPTGVDRATFKPKVRKIPKPDMIFIGRVADWSGLDEVLEAMPLIADLGPTLKIIVPVDPPFQQVLDTKIAALSLQDSVIFLGDQPREVVACELDKAGVGLACFHPTDLRVHAAPLKLLEYMASGLPVIAFAGSEAGDMTTKYDVGIACETNGLELAAAIEKVCTDPDQYKAMSRNGPKAVPAYEWKQIMAAEYAQLMTIYQLTSKVAA